MRYSLEPENEKKLELLYKRILSTNHSGGISIIRRREKSLPKLTIETNCSLNYNIIEGGMDSPYLVFLHEGLGCEAMWGGFPELLCEATGCPGLIYDRLGYGNSSPLNSAHTVHYMHEYALQELPKLLEKVCPGKAFILVGHSDGGSISLIYGAARPSLLKGIITEAAHVFVEPKTISNIRSADEAWEKGLLRGLLKYHGDKTETIFKAWSTIWLASWFEHWNIEYLLPCIEVPLLVIQGTDDQYGSAGQVNSIVNKSSGNAQLEMVENCGHAPHLEAQPIVLEAMTNFIAQIK